MTKALDHNTDPVHPAEVLQRVGAPEGSALPLPRILVVLAHPDDEVLALGGRLQRFATSWFVTLTDGAPQGGADAQHHGFASLESYREARQHELRAAFAEAGLAADCLLRFESVVPDQTASLHLVSLSRSLASLIERLQPQAVLTHPYEGGHPDHDACAFVVATAIRLVSARKVSGPVPSQLEAPSYHIGAGGKISTGSFLEDRAETEALECRLTAEEQERKRRRLACFPSQMDTLQQFGLESERFRVAPQYDFGRRPHAGQLFYEQFPWRMTGDRFCDLTREAERELFGSPSSQSRDGEVSSGSPA